MYLGRIQSKSSAIDHKFTSQVIAYNLRNRGHKCFTDISHKWAC